MFIGPGQFDIRGPTQNKVEKFEVTDQASLEFNFDAPRPETGKLTGRVVTGEPPRPVPNAVRYGIYRQGLATEPAEIDHFLKLLTSTAPRLTEEQAATLRKGLTTKPEPKPAASKPAASKPGVAKPGN